MISREIVKLLERRISGRSIKIKLSKEKILKSLAGFKKGRDSRIYLPESEVPLKLNKKGFGIWYDTSKAHFGYLGLSREAAEKIIDRFFKLGGYCETF